MCLLTWRHCKSALAITCSAPLEGFNTEPVKENRSFIVGEPYTYSCKVGYASDDNLTVICQDDGTWSAYAPICEGL